MSLIIDLSNYKDRFGSRVPEGTHEVIVEDVEMDKSKAGNPMLNVWYRVVGGEADGLTLIDRLTITEKALFRVVGFMQAVGLPTPRKRLQINPQSFIGKRLRVEVEDGEPYNGRVRSEVRGYQKSADAAAKRADATDLPEEGEPTPFDLPEDAAPAETVEDRVHALAGKITEETGPVDLDSIDLG